MSDRNAIHKSSLPQLIKRGYIDYLPIEDDHYTYDESLAKLQSKMAVERSIAARTLKQHILKKGVAEELISALIKEKALYTKLEISDALALGNRTTLLLMLPYVRSMKNHQYDVVPKQPSRKKSFPLPRDGIARIIGKMNSIYIPLLIEKLFECSLLQARELADAIGYMIYQKKKLPRKSYDLLFEYYLSCEDEVLQWKLFRAIAVSTPYSKAFLQSIRKEDTILAKEAIHALKSYY